jgi:CDGSH-type Zn-finger protein
MIGAKEHITHEPGNNEAWICQCGNRPDSDGFFPCNKEGNEMEPVEGWEEQYVFGRCGPIIDQVSLEVVGQNPTFKLLG